MRQYLVGLKDIRTGDQTLWKGKAESKEEAEKLALEGARSFGGDWIAREVKHTHGGSRGGGRISKWGEGVKTERFRLPENFGRSAQEIMQALDDLRETLEQWEEAVEQSTKKSSSGKPSERYKYVAEICKQIRNDLNNIPDSW